MEASPVGPQFFSGQTLRPGVAFLHELRQGLEELARARPLQSAIWLQLPTWANGIPGHPVGGGMTWRIMEVRARTRVHPPTKTSMISRRTLSRTEVNGMSPLAGGLPTGHPVSANGETHFGRVSPPVEDRCYCMGTARSGMTLSPKARNIRYGIHPSGFDSLHESCWLFIGPSAGRVLWKQRLWNGAQRQWCRRRWRDRRWRYHDR
jgi:hypothetical protein